MLNKILQSNKQSTILEAKEGSEENMDDADVKVDDQINVDGDVNVDYEDNVNHPAHIFQSQGDRVVPIFVFAGYIS